MRRHMPAFAIAVLALGAFAVSPAAAQDEAGDFVPLETCAGCHDEAESFAAGPHGRAMARRGAEVLERSCVACHGPGETHAGEPEAANIVRRPSDEACASCHTGSSGLLALANPAHERHDLACLDCHLEGHSDEGAEHLLAAEPFELCGGCHAEQKSAAYRPFAHRDGSRPFACTNCHSGHGTTRTGRLADFDASGPCLDCHTEKAGPFVFPHPAREVSGCLACHQPHGSANPRLLTRRTVLTLCLECHTGVPAFHNLTQARFRACQSCHTAVHGSNRDARLFDE